MREDYHIYYENEEELSVGNKNVMANRKKRRQKYALYNDISRKKCNL